MARKVDTVGDVLENTSASALDQTTTSVRSLAGWVRLDQFSDTQNNFSQFAFDLDDGSNSWKITFGLSTDSKVTTVGLSGVTNFGGTDGFAIDGYTSGNWLHIYLLLDYAADSITYILTGQGQVAGNILNETGVIGTTHAIASGNVSVGNSTSRNNSDAPLLGAVLDFVILDSTPTTAELDSHRSGTRADSVWSTSILGYWPIDGSSPEPDFSGTTDLSVTGTTIESDPAFIDPVSSTTSQVIKNTLQDESGSPLANLSGLNYRVWSSVLPSEATDANLVTSAIDGTTDANGEFRVDVSGLGPVAGDDLGVSISTAASTDTDTTAVRGVHRIFTVVDE